MSNSKPAASFKGTFQILPGEIVQEAGVMLKKAGDLEASNINLRSVPPEKMKNIPGFTGIDLLLWTYMKNEFDYAPYEIVTVDGIPPMCVLFKNDNEMVLAEIRAYVISAMEDPEGTWKERIVKLKEAWQSSKRKAKERDGVNTTICHVDYEGISPVNFLVVEGFSPDPEKVEF